MSNVHHAPANAPGTGLPTYWARWVGYDNQPGPWSIACRTTIKANVDANADDAESATESDAGEQPLKIAA